MLRQHFVVYRSAGSGVIADPAQLDPAVPTISAEGYSAQQLIALVDEAAAKRGMAVLLFHGVGAEYLNVTREAHAALLDHLARHRQRFDRQLRQHHGREGASTQELDRLPWRPFQARQRRPFTVFMPSLSGSRPTLRVGLRSPYRPQPP